jgi:histidinol-phosphate aminotransferase
MYAVSAQINDVSVQKVNLDFTKKEFGLQTEKVIEKLAENPSIKLVYFCSPGNPTGSLLRQQEIEKVLQHPTWNGMVVVDEAYIDFAPPGSSLAPLVTKYPNLAVMQTLSKSFGLAGVRCGATFASPEFARLLNALKAPYNISTPTSEIAKRALSKEGIAKMRELTAKVNEQRDRLINELPKIPGIGDFVGGFDSNFVLVEILSKAESEGGVPSNVVAKQVYERLAENRQIVVRYRGSEPGCTGCIRISVGTKEENDRVLQELRSVLRDVYTS